MLSESFLRVQHLLPLLKRYCLKLAINEWDADDLMQEVLAKVHRSLQQSPDRELSKAYLKQIASRAWIDRSRSKQAKLTETEFDENMHVPPSPPVDELSVRELFEQLAERLNVRQMVLVLLVDIFRFTAPETAQLLRSTHGAVKEGVKRARSRLRSLAAETDRREESRKADGPPLSKEMFERFLSAFRAGNATEICRTYLTLVSSGVLVDKVALKERRVYFTFRDPNGHLISFFQDF